MVTDLHSSITEKLQKLLSQKLSRKQFSFLAKVPLLKLIVQKFLPWYHRNTRLGYALTNVIIVG